MSEIIGNYVVGLILPFGIPLPDDEYHVQINEKLYKCRLRAIPNPEFPWEATEKAYVNVVYDRRGRQYFTSAWVILPIECKGTDNVFIAQPDGTVSEVIGNVRVKDKRVEQAVSVVNQLINVYRYTSKEFHIPNIAYMDIKYHLGLADKEKGRISYDKDIHDPDFSKLPRFKFNEAQWEMGKQVKQFLENNQEIPITDELMLKAKEFFLWEDYRFALLCSVVGLESVVNQFLEKRFSQKKLHSKAVEHLLGAEGISFRTKIDVISEELEQMNKENIKDELSECKDAIVLRNDIAHGKQPRNPLTLNNF